MQRIIRVSARLDDDGHRVQTSVLGGIPSASPRVQIDYAALRGWTAAPDHHVYVPRLDHPCAHCRRRPVSSAPWRPFNRLMAQLCSDCRIRTYRFAEQIAARTGRRVAEHLDQILQTLRLEVN